MIAKYIGANSGIFIPNETYDIHEKIYHDGKIDDYGVKRHVIVIFNCDESKYIVYKDLSSVLRDWTVEEGE